MMSRFFPLANKRSQAEKSSKREEKADVGLRAPFATALSCEPSEHKSVQMTSLSPNLVLLRTSA